MNLLREKCGDELEAIIPVNIQINLRKRIKRH